MVLSLMPTIALADDSAAETIEDAILYTINDGGEPDVIAGASKSSNGIIKGVKRALELYEKLQKEGVLK